MDTSVHPPSQATMAPQQSQKTPPTPGSSLHDVRGLKRAGNPLLRAPPPLLILQFAELSGADIKHGLADFLLGVHHEGAVLDHWLSSAHSLRFSNRTIATIATFETIGPAHECANMACSLSLPEATFHVSSKAVGRGRNAHWLRWRQLRLAALIKICSRQIWAQALSVIKRTRMVQHVLTLS